MKNFDLFIGIDWSGAKTPVQTKSIALAKCVRGSAPPVMINAPAGFKYWSRAQVHNYIHKLINTKQRVFVGIDANFGYAFKVGSEQFGDNYSAHEVWAAIDKANEDQDNFFAEKFWEAYPEYFWTSGKKPDHITLPQRKTEIVCGEAGYGWPESPFKLIGPKQVGKGGLAAMRMAHHLKKELGDKICIWPFEQENADSAQIVMSEIYPRQFLRRSGHGNAKIRTLEELNVALEYFGSKPMKEKRKITDHESDALISAAGLRWLCGDKKTIPSALSHPSLLDQRSSRVEGWIFGVGGE